MATKKGETKEVAKRSTARTPPAPPPAPASRITTRSKTEAPKLARPPHQPTNEEIARRAYQLYVQRGYQHGHHLEDWQRAETELRAGR